MAPEFNLSNFQNCVKDLLQQYCFDFDKFTEGQERLLFNYLSGHDCIGVHPTNYIWEIFNRLIFLLLFLLLLWLKIRLRGVQK